MHYSFFFTVEPENDVDNPVVETIKLASGILRGVHLSIPSAEHSLTGKLPLPKNGEFTSQAPAQAIRPFTEAIAAMLVAPIMMNQAAPTSMLHEVANDLLLLL